MKWSELPNTLSKEAQKHLDNASQSSNKQAYGYKGDILVDNIEKGFVLPEKWCVRGYTNDNVHKWFNERLKREIATSVINYFHYPEIELNVCTSCAISSGYTEITYDQWVKYVKDAEYKENALRENDNLEKIKEMRDVVNDKDQDHLQPFYMIYVDGASGSTKKHDYESACKEAYRLSKETDKKVFILRSVEYFERNVEIKNTILK